MASIKFGDFQIDIVVHNTDGIFEKIFNMSLPRGFWVLLTIQNEKGKKEVFPRVDDDSKIKTFASYDEAIDDIAQLLKEYLR